MNPVEIADLEVRLFTLPLTVGERTQAIQQVRLGSSTADLALGATALAKARWLVLIWLTAIGVLAGGIAWVDFQSSEAIGADA